MGLHRRVGGCVQAEGRLAHGGPGAHDDQRVGLEPRQELVEIVEARRGAGDGLLALVERLEPIEAQVQKFPELDHRVRDATLSDIEDHRFGEIDGLGDVVER